MYYHSSQTSNIKTLE